MGNLDTLGYLSASKKRKVVVIDDEEPVLQIMKTFFFSFCPKCEIEYTTDPHAGLIKIGEIQPDVVLLDLEMGELNGVDICKKIRADKKLENVKIIIISGFIEKYKDELEQLEIYEIIPKPFRYSNLRKILKPIFE